MNKNIFKYISKYIPDFLTFFSLFVRIAALLAIVAQLAQNKAEDLIVKTIGSNKLFVDAFGAFKNNYFGSKVLSIIDLPNYLGKIVLLLCFVFIFGSIYYTAHNYVNGYKPNSFFPKFLVGLSSAVSYSTLYFYFIRSSSILLTAKFFNLFGFNVVNSSLEAKESQRLELKKQFIDFYMENVNTIYREKILTINANTDIKIPFEEIVSFVTRQQNYIYEKYLTDDYLDKVLVSPNKIPYLESARELAIKHLDDFLNMKRESLLLIKQTLSNRAAEVINNVQKTSYDDFISHAHSYTSYSYYTFMIVFGVVVVITTATVIYFYRDAIAEIWSGIGRVIEAAATTDSLASKMNNDYKELAIQCKNMSTNIMEIQVFREKIIDELEGMAKSISGCQQDLVVKGDALAVINKLQSQIKEQTAMSEQIQLDLESRIGRLTTRVDVGLMTVAQGNENAVSDVKQQIFEYMGKHYVSVDALSYLFGFTKELLRDPQSQLNGSLYIPLENRLIGMLELTKQLNDRMAILENALKAK